MFQRALPVLLVFFLYGIGNAEPLIQPIRLTISQSPELLPSQNSESVNTPEKVKTDVVKSDVSKSDVAKSPNIKPADNQANNPAVPANIAPEEAAANALELLPHRATYSITLNDTHDDEDYDDEDIADVKGQMTIQLAKAGEGWAIEQKCTVHIYHKDGTAEQVITTLATYETMDGLKYSFNERILKGDQEETISGDAILASKGGAGIVTYQEPDESTIQLPVGTIFPTQHLIHMLQAAMRGQKIVSNIVFDGSSETHEPVQVNTVLGASQDAKLTLTNQDEKLALKNKNLWQAKKMWPMRMAIYAMDSDGPEADYEIEQNVLDRGVIRDMTLDYGTFKVKAVLNQVEIFS